MTISFNSTILITYPINFQPSKANHFNKIRTINKKNNKSTPIELIYGIATRTTLSFFSELFWHRRTSFVLRKLFSTSNPLHASFTTNLRRWLHVKFNRKPSRHVPRPSSTRTLFVVRPPTPLKRVTCATCTRNFQIWSVIVIFPAHTFWAFPRKPPTRCST